MNRCHDLLIVVVVVVVQLFPDEVYQEYISGDNELFTVRVTYTSYTLPTQQINPMNPMHMSHYTMNYFLPFQLGH